MKKFTKVPLAYVKASVDDYDLSTAKYGDTIHIDSGDDFWRFLEAWQDDDRERYGHRFKFKLILSDAAIQDLSSELERMLYYLKQMSTNFKELKSQISETLTEFYYNIDTDYIESARHTLEDIKNTMTSLHQLGLTAVKRGSSIIIKYQLNPNIYNIQSAEYQNNVESISRMLESIPSISRAKQSKHSDGSYVWQCYINKGDGLDSYPQVVPEFEAVPMRNDGVVIYNVAIVTPPQYMSRLPFRYAKPNEEMYMVQNIKLTALTDSPADFMSELYKGDVPFTADSWEQVADYFDDMPYISNGELIVNTVPCKITQTINGKRNTIYNKRLPDASNIENMERYTRTT